MVFTIFPSENIFITKSKLLEEILDNQSGTAAGKLQIIDLAVSRVLELIIFFILIYCLFCFFGLVGYRILEMSTRSVSLESKKMMKEEKKRIV